MSYQLVRKTFRTARRLTGISPKSLLMPYYWIPYNVYGSGRAWRPLFVTFDLTYLCNLRCSMCALVNNEMVSRRGQAQHEELVQGDGELRTEMSTGEYLRCIDQLARAHVQSVRFTGGEPTLRSDFLELARAVVTGGIRLEINSNGSTSPQLFRELVRLGVDSIQISIDGTRDVHDRIRGVRGSFDKAVAAIEAMLSERARLSLHRPTVTVGCTISSANLGNLSAYVNAMRPLRTDAINIGHLHYSTSASQAATREIVAGPVVHHKNATLPPGVISLDSQALIEEIEQVRGETRAWKQRVIFTPDLSPAEIVDRYSGNAAPFASRCFYPWFAARIDPWGQMYPCWIDIRLGDVRETEILELWNAPLYRAFRRLIRLQGVVPKCATCCALTDRSWSRLPRLRHRLGALPAAENSQPVVP